ncbi:HNH endonuclease [Glutamicibacter arilaitensis]|nr:HNH endonuclease [Glutamicibacter arilaitensis]
MAGNQYRSTANFKRLSANLRAAGNPCWLCGQAIDYSVGRYDDEGNENGNSFSVDHVVPWSVDETLREDPGNLRAAHLSCNKSRGKRAAPAGLGLLSRDW